MSKLITNLFLFVILLTSNSFFAQTKSDNPIKKIHYYTFSGSATQEQLEKLQTEVADLEFVTETKFEYKAEKSKGQIRILTAEPKAKNENDPLFSPYNVKQIFIKLGFEPGEYRFENQ